MISVSFELEGDIFEMFVHVFNYSFVSQRQTLRRD